MHPQLLQLDIWLMSGEEKRRFWLQFFFFFTILHSPLTNCENCQRAVWGGSQKSNRQLATCNSKSATVQHVELLAKLQILSQLNNCHTKTRERKKKTNRLRFSFPFTRNVFYFINFFIVQFIASGQFTKRYSGQANKFVWILFLVFISCSIFSILAKLFYCIFLYIYFSRLLLNICLFFIVLQTKLMASKMAVFYVKVA